MKATILSLLVLLSATSHAGGGADFGSGPIDTTVLNCFQILPVQEGEATASVHLGDNGLKMGYSNHVNDFNISFEPVKVIERIIDAAQLITQGRLMVFATVSQDLSVTIDAIELLASTGTVVGQIEVNGKKMQGRCSVNLNNLKQALK